MSAVAQRMGVDTQKLTEILVHAGASEQTLKSRLKAQLAWNALVRGRFKASLEIADSDVEAQLHLHQPDQKGNVGYEYTMRPIVFVVPAGSPDSAYEARKREAEALRARFANCADGHSICPRARRSRGARPDHQILGRPAASSRATFSTAPRSAT